MAGTLHMQMGCSHAGALNIVMRTLCTQQWEARREQLKTREEEASAARASQNKYLEDGGRGPDAGGGDSTGGTGGGAESGKASAEAEATSYNINEQ